MGQSLGGGSRHEHDGCTVVDQIPGWKPVPIRIIQRHQPSWEGQIAHRSGSDLGSHPMPWSRGPKEQRKRWGMASPWCSFPRKWLGWFRNSCPSKSAWGRPIRPWQLDESGYLKHQWIGRIGSHEIFDKLVEVPSGLLQFAHPREGWSPPVGRPWARLHWVSQYQEVRLQCHHCPWCHPVHQERFC